MSHTPTEVDLRKAEHRGQQAKALLANPILNEAFAKVEAKCIDLWKASSDPADREGLWVRVQLLGTLRTAIEGVVKEGDIAEQKLRHLLKGGPSY